MLCMAGQIKALDLVLLDPEVTPMPAALVPIPDGLDLLARDSRLDPILEEPRHSRKAGTKVNGDNKTFGYFVVLHELHYLTLS